VSPTDKVKDKQAGHRKGRTVRVRKTPNEKKNPDEKSKGERQDDATWFQGDEERTDAPTKRAQAEGLERGTKKRTWMTGVTRCRVVEKREFVAKKEVRKWKTRGVGSKKRSTGAAV